MEKDKARIGAILKSLSTLSGRSDIVNAEGNLDIEKFNALPEVQSTIAELKSAGVRHNTELSSLGFVAGAMALRF